MENTNLRGENMTSTSKEDISFNTAVDAAGYIVSEAYTCGDIMTYGKLHKLLYLAEAFHLVRYDGRLLFPEKIQAREYGPVVVSDHPILQEWGKDNYCEFIPFLNQKRTGEEEGEVYKLGVKALDCLRDTLRFFMDRSAYILMRQIIQSTPFIEAIASNNKMVSPSRMYQFYRNVWPFCNFA